MVGWSATTGGQEFAVTRRADVFFVVMVGLAAATLCPAVASAATQCKSATVTTVSGGTEDLASAAWSAQVKQSFGAAWSDFSLAKNPKFSDQNLGLGTLITVTATPCRTTPTVPAVPITKPIGAIQRH
jgi:hypothetical protein